MKVAILQCDEVLDKFQAEFGNYPQMIKRMFVDVAPALHFKTFNCQLLEFPADINTYDFFITTGSKASVYDELPWIKQLIEFIRTLDQHKKKLIGICFGHQLIAKARNLEVKKAKQGWGVGIAKNDVVQQPKWAQKNITKLNILVSHQDQISQLPSHAKIIAKSDFCPYFVVQWDNHFLSIQGHPEWSAGYSRALIQERKTILTTDNVNEGIASLTTAPDNALFASWIMDFVKQTL